MGCVCLCQLLPGAWLQICVTLFILTVQGEDLQQEQDAPAGELQLEDALLTGRDEDERIESMGTEAIHEGRTLFFFFWFQNKIQ